MPPDPTISGSASLHVANVRQLSTVVGAWARSPLSILTPRSRGQSVWAYTSSFGGGMVAGDETRLEVKVDPGARCFLSTQASTKIYRNPAQRPCSHRMEVTLGPGSLLVLAPDPVQCFAQSSYQQHQNFKLAADSNLVLVDWISGGRSARGERWAFHSYSSKNHVYRDGRLLLLDAIVLDQQNASIANRFRTGRFNCLATLVILGKLLAESATSILNSIQALPIERGADLAISASPLHEGVILRLSGTSVEAVGRAIYNQLQFVPKLLHGDPWSRKW